MPRSVRKLPRMPRRSFPLNPPLPAAHTGPAEPFSSSIRLYICVLLMLGIGIFGALMKKNYASAGSILMPIIVIGMLLHRDWTRWRDYRQQNPRSTG